MGKIKILLADDHQMFLDGLCSIFSLMGEVEIIGAVNNGNEVIKKLNYLSPDLIIVDLNMPTLDGLETTKLITKEYPNIKILGLTMDNNLESVKKMLEAGASGYILKNTGKEELERAIKQIVKGEPYLSESISAQLTQSLFQNLQKKDEDLELNTLTGRELEILKMVALENSNSEIAKTLFISPKTVETHRKNLMRKIGVKNSLGVFKFALKHRIIEE